MAKYVCSVCGYTYDEEKEKTKFAELPNDWKCPLCGADKNQFELKDEQPMDSPKATKIAPTSNAENHSNHQLSNAEMCILCTNLAKGCEKQYMEQESKLFMEIADYYKKNSESLSQDSYDDISKLLDIDLKQNYPIAFEQSKEDQDRGALRALTWSEKVSKIVNSLISRYNKEGTKFLENTKIFVCEICGFIFVGDQAPEVCPVCKVPKLKIHEIGRN